jgi:hypothetical protein
MKNDCNEIYFLLNKLQENSRESAEEGSEAVAFTEEEITSIIQNHFPKNSKTAAWEAKALSTCPNATTKHFCSIIDNAHPNTLVEVAANIPYRQLAGSCSNDEKQALVAMFIKMKSKALSKGTCSITPPKKCRDLKLFIQGKNKALLKKGTGQDTAPIPCPEISQCPRKEYCMKHPVSNICLNTRKNINRAFNHNLLNIPESTEGLIESLTL